MSFCSEKTTTNASVLLQHDSSIFKKVQVDPAAVVAVKQLDAMEFNYFKVFY